MLASRRGEEEDKEALCFAEGQSVPAPDQLLVTAPWPGHPPALPARGHLTACCMHLTCT